MLTPALLFLGALLSLGAPAADEPWSGTVPAALPLGSYSTNLAARLSLDGRVDTGAVVARLVDLGSGEPIEADGPAFGPGPALWVQWRSQRPGYALREQLAANTTIAKSDRRLALAWRLEVHNSDAEAHDVTLALELSPATDPALTRPDPSLSFEPGEVWTVDGLAVLRAGHVVARVPDDVPEIEILAPPTAPDDVAARLVWRLSIPAGETRFLEASLAGPPATDVVDEQAWRAKFVRRTYDFLAEELDWQSRYHGAFGRFQSADPRMRGALVASVAQIRMLGAAGKRVRSLSDHAYGWPASDSAVEAQMLGVLFEYRMGDIAGEFLDELLRDAEARMKGLPTGRQLMYLHGLARAVRLILNGSHDQRLADLIEGFFAPGFEDGELAVDPWLDPDHVRADLMLVLSRAGRTDAAPLPRLAWAEVQPGSTQDFMQQFVRALAARDGATVGTLLDGLLSRTSKRGFASMQPGGELDGTWALASSTLFREMLIDDHGEELHMFPGANDDLLSLQLDLETDFHPTRFGLLKEHEFFTSPRLLGGWVNLNQPVWPERIVMHFPPGSGLKRTKGDPAGGTARVIDENSVELTFAPSAPRGLRFTVRREMGGEQQGAGGDGGRRKLKRKGKHKGDGD